MNYTPEQFFRLTEMIQKRNGVHLDELCAARTYDLTGPKGRRPGKKLYMPGCGNYSIFSIPYEGEGGKEGTVRLCAVCDDLGASPQFESCMETG